MAGSCSNVAYATLFTTSVTSIESLSLSTSYIDAEPIEVITESFLCSGCKISGVPPIPEYCLGEYVPEKPSGGDVCSNWVTSSSTSYQTGGSRSQIVYTVTTTVPSTSIYATATQYSTICTTPPTTPDPVTPGPETSSRKPDPVVSSSQQAPDTPSSRSAAAGTTPTSVPARTSAAASSFTSISTSIALSAVPVTVTANGSTIVRTSTSSFAVNATIIGNTTAEIINTNATGGGSSAPVGAIAGGVVGGIVALVAFGGFFWWRRRQARKEEEAGGAGGNYWAEDDNGPGPVMTNTYRAPGVATGALLEEGKDDPANHVEPYVPSVGYGAASVPTQSQYGSTQAGGDPFVGGNAAAYGVVGAAAAGAAAYGVVHSADSARNEKAQLMASYAANDALSQHGASSSAGGGYDTYAGSTATGSSQPSGYPPVSSPSDQYSLAGASYQQTQQQQPTSPVDSQFGQRASAQHVHASPVENPLTGFVIPTTQQGQAASQSKTGGAQSPEPVPGQASYGAAGQDAAAGPSNAQGGDEPAPPLYSPTA